MTLATSTSLQSINFFSRYLGFSQWTNASLYSSFIKLAVGDCERFLEAHYTDCGPFGGANRRTKWSGYQVVQNIDRVGKNIDGRCGYKTMFESVVKPLLDEGEDISDVPELGGLCCSWCWLFTNGETEFISRHFTMAPPLNFYCKHGQLWRLRRGIVASNCWKTFGQTRDVLQEIWWQNCMGKQSHEPNMESGNYRYQTAQPSRKFVDGLHLSIYHSARCWAIIAGLQSKRCLFYNSVESSRTCPWRLRFRSIRVIAPRKDCALY